MEQYTQGIEMDQKKVLERVLQRASALWGIDNPRDLDPIVKLILEVLGYEISGLNQTLHQHQGRILEELADILLPDQWKNASPSHGIISAIPLEATTDLIPEHQFYLKVKTLKYAGTESIEEHFFSPLGLSPLLKGSLNTQIHEADASMIDEQGRTSMLHLGIFENFSTQEVWIGIEVPPATSILEELCLYIELPSRDWRLIPMLKHCQFETEQGQELSTRVHSFLDTDKAPNNESSGKVGLEDPAISILRSIEHHYQGQFLSISNKGGHISIHPIPLPQPLASNSILQEHDHFQTPRLWVKATFPAAFEAKSIKRTIFRINALPAINRKLQRHSLRLTSGPNLVRLEIPQGYTFFGIHSILDESDRPYTKKRIGDLPAQAGTFSLHQIQLERIDKETAQDHLTKLIRIVREDSALFKAYGYEVMLRQMSDLKNSLEEITKQINVSDTSKRPEKQYMLLYPYESSGQIDLHYWVVPDPWDISAIASGSELQQYKGIVVEAGSCKFQNPLHPGKSALQNEDKVKRLLGSIVSKERIVSKSDIRLFIHQSLGNWISEISISGGVSISPDPRRGFVRTTDISIQPSNTCPLTEKGWESLLHGLSQEINDRSIHTANYRIQLTTQPVFQND